MALRYAAALPILADHGLLPNPSGFDPTDLSAFAADRGWTARAERVSGGRGVRRWRATVLAHAPIGGCPVAVVGGTCAHGESEAAALAVALASMLRRTGRQQAGHPGGEVGGA